MLLRENQLFLSFSVLLKEFDDNLIAFLLNLLWTCFLVKITLGCYYKKRLSKLLGQSRETCAPMCTTSISDSQCHPKEGTGKQH